ncbi:hypothetical protein VKT23_019850 [Stygiomarasmius scandens]|uniref:Uricase n=1 Tax=Marasmiellus scandens TaxID=2682957 RepID=A0ABR1IPC7_9AGAR
MAELSYLSHARYGKDKVRVLRVVREGSWHHVVEYNVLALLEGDIDVSYTKADNSVVVATDSIKNITYYLAKVSPHILIPERFALHLGTHLVSKYSHIHKAFVTIEQLRWTRIPVESDGQIKPHAHSFYRDGDEKRVVTAEIDASAGKNKIVAKVTAGVNDLLILKSTGSAFTNFLRDEYTTLVEVDDRIFSTSVDLSYAFTQFDIPAPKDDKKLEFIIPKEEPGSIWDPKVPETARKVTLETFAEDDSASVQASCSFFSLPPLLGCIFSSSASTGGIIGSCIISSLLRRQERVQSWKWSLCGADLMILRAGAPLLSSQLDFWARTTKSSMHRPGLDSPSNLDLAATLVCRKD